MSKILTNKGQLMNVVILRSLAIVMVVLYHCYCPWLKAWDWFPTPLRPTYSFIFECMLVGRMPLFASVSGYLFAHLFLDRGKYGTFGVFLKNKTRRLLIPCVLFLAIMCLCLQGNFIEELIGYGYHLWFLKMLFVSFMITWLILKYVHKRWDFLVLLLSVILAFTPSIHFFALEQFQKYYMFFYGGVLLYKYRESLKFLSSQNSVLILCLIYLSLLLLVLWRYLTGDPHGDIIHSDLIVVYLRIIIRVFFVLIAFSVVDYVIQNKREMSLPLLVKINKLSFGIYLFHFLYIKILYKYFYSTIINLGSYDIIGPVIFFAFIMVLSIFSAILVNKTKWGAYLIG